MKSFRWVALAVVTFFFAVAPALAIVGQGPEWSATYVAAYQPIFGSKGVPYSGEMKLKFNHGIISGTYQSTSVRPDPMQGRIISVSGTASKGNVMLYVGSLNVRNGEIESDGTITGTAHYQGKLWEFMAKVKSSP